MTDPTIPTTASNIEVRLSLLEQRDKSLRHELFGNGQPGRLSKIEKKIDQIDDKTGKIVVAVVFLASTVSSGATAVVMRIVGM